MTRLSQSKVKTTKQLTVRVDAAMLKQIEKAKADNHMNTAEVIRYALSDGISGKLILSDQQATALMREFRENRGREDQILTKLGELLDEVSRVEKSFTKMVRKVHQAGLPLDEKKTKDNIKLLNRYLEQFIDEGVKLWQLYTSQVQEMAHNLSVILKEKGTTDTKGATK